MLVFYTEIFDWKETIHRDEKYAGDDHSDHPHHQAIPAIGHIDRYASEEDVYALALMYQRMQHPVSKFLRPLLWC